MLVAGCPELSAWSLAGSSVSCGYQGRLMFGENFFQMSSSLLEVLYTHSNLPGIKFKPEVTL